MDEFDRYFDALDIRRGASLEEIKRAHRDLVQVWHPDRYTNNPRLRAKAEEKLKLINDAYDRLCARQAGPQPRQEAPPRGENVRSARGDWSQPPPTPDPPPAAEDADDFKQPPAAAEPGAAEDPRSFDPRPVLVVGFCIAAFVMAARVGQNGAIEPGSAPPPDKSQASQAPPATNLEQDLAALKAEIENRKALNKVEFARLNIWKEEGVAPQDAASYRAAREKAQEEEQEIETMVLTYTFKKKLLQGH